MNNHASAISPDLGLGTPEPHRAFQEFIRLFKESEFKEDFLDGSPTAVTHAYNKFLDSMASEVQNVVPQIVEATCAVQRLAAEAAAAAERLSAVAERLAVEAVATNALQIGRAHV